MSTTETTEQAYAACERITRHEAGNFYYGIRLLPQAKRSALCALYALARRIDDIGDGDLPLAHKERALSAVRKDLGSLDESTDPVLMAVADTARRFPVPLEAFEELVDGVQTDLLDVAVPDLDELIVYCRRVAGSVGRLCLSVFGTTTGDPRTPLFADQLGIALQQTNILRDIAEDLGNGRVYLPADELERFGVQLRFDDADSLDDPTGRLAGYIRFSAGRAADWYSLGTRLVDHLDRRSAACCGAMVGIYRRLLTRIADDHARVYDRRVSLSGAEKAGVALRALTGGSR